MLKGAYLNYASTNAKVSGNFNPSDIYSDNTVLMDKFGQFVHKLCVELNAPIGSRVILNSGSTESISNVIFWAKNINPFGTVVGTDFDHSSVKANAELHKMNYQQKLHDNTSLLFLTHVKSSTGEILDVDKIVDNINNYTFINEESTMFITDGSLPMMNVDDEQPSIITDSSSFPLVMQNRPLIVLDAAQSIMKIPIDMTKWTLDAVFFSLHKLGGPIGVGVLVIAPGKTFTPLIAGSQQDGLRGGTFPFNIDFEKIMVESSSIRSRKKKWEKAKEFLENEKISVYSPKHKHLYNTLLIDTKDKCSDALIKILADDNIYVGNLTACSKGGHNIRISFDNEKEINNKILKKIVKTINEVH
ncbi:MAG: aminotransferase class V-fold PLP-dependent enzyme [Acholeplasmataceae bacterium]